MESTVIQDGKNPYMAQNTQKGIDINRKGINFSVPIVSEIRQGKLRFCMNQGLQMVRIVKYQNKYSGKKGKSSLMAFVGGLDKHLMVKK